MNVNKHGPFINLKKYSLLILISITSLIIALLVAEVALRFSSYLRTSSRQEHKDNGRYWGWRNSKEVINIVALGDSYTFGGFGKNHDTYPSELSRQLSANNAAPAVVYNHGICEYTSGQVLSQIPSSLLLTHADIALILVGAADLYDPYPFATELMSASSKLDRGIRKLQLYKALRYLYYKAESYLYKRKILELSNEHLFSFTSLYKNFDQLELKIATLSREDLATRLNYLSKDAKPLTHQQRLELALTAYALDEYETFFNNIEIVINKIDSMGKLEDSNEFRDRLGLYILKFYLDEKITNINTPHPSPHYNKYIHAINMLKVGLGPKTKWAVGLLLRQVYFNQIQATQVIEAIKFSFSRYPYLRSDERMIATLLALTNFSFWRKQVLIWFKENIEKIIIASLKDETFPVLQTYPISIFPINNIIREMAEKFEVPLVDHEKIFAPYLLKDYRKYILDQNHCTDEGHKLMAKNVYEVLQKQFFSNPDKVKKLVSHGGRFLKLNPTKKEK